MQSMTPTHEEEWEAEYEKLWERDVQMGPATVTFTQIPEQQKVKLDPQVFSG